MSFLSILCLTLRFCRINFEEPQENLAARVPTKCVRYRPALYQTDDGPQRRWMQSNPFNGQVHFRIESCHWNRSGPLSKCLPWQRCWWMPAWTAAWFLYVFGKMDRWTLNTTVVVAKSRQTVFFLVTLRRWRKSSWFTVFTVTVHVLFLNKNGLPITAS